EVDCYMDARKDFPKSNVTLETRDASYYHMKTDIFNRIMWYSSDPNSGVNLIAVPVDRVKEIIELNGKGTKPVKLLEVINETAENTDLSYSNVIPEESLTRFDEAKKKSQRKRNKKGRRRKRNE
ncbi:MAG: hypothetical protein GX467_06270, partial [Rikenellaceae bacterium]|nr:hypothetical protein [Rikenellaceae bacterium]